MTTITGTYVTGASPSAADNPLTIASTGSITNSAGVSLACGNGVAWTLTNYGTITSPGANGSGVFFFNDGTQNNTLDNRGYVSGSVVGVEMYANTAKVTNSGTIIGTGTPSYGVILQGTVGSTLVNQSHGFIGAGKLAVEVVLGPGHITNAGTVSAGGVGVSLAKGGTVSNNLTGTIHGGKIGIQIQGGSAMVTNSGTIAAGPTIYGYYGIELKSGGSVTNGRSSSASGLISGYHYGIFIEGGAGTVNNFATITGGFVVSDVPRGDCVRLLAGGSVSNGATGQIAGPASGIYIAGGAGTVTNAGTISAPVHYAVDLQAGGTITNAAGASIVSGDGVNVDGAAGVVTNLGTIDSAYFDGVFLRAGGSVTNGQSNAVEASIIAHENGVDMRSGGTVTDFGVIAGQNFGIFSGAGGSVTINRDALVSGFGGIYIENGAGTVIVAGAVAGTGGVAIQFDKFNSVPDKLILDPTAQFSGTVDGGAGIDTIELRAGAAAGTLAGLGSVFINFEIVQVDPGATWTVEVAAQAPGQIIAGSGGASRLVFTKAGAIDLTGVNGFASIALAGLGASSTSLADSNFNGLTSPLITVTGGNFGNTVDASGLTGSNRIVLTGGLRADHFAGGAGNDVFRFSAANLTASDTVNGGGGSDTLQMTTAGTVNAGGVSGVETVQLAGGGANNLTLTDANFAGVTGAAITVIGGAGGNTVNAAAVSGAHRIVAVGGAGADHFTGGAGNDGFQFTAANLAASDTVAGGGGTDQLTMLSAGTVNAGGVAGVETIALAGGGANSLTLANANFTGVSGTTITVRGGANGNTVDATAVTGSNRLVFIGGAGADIVKPGAAATMTGGAGANQFVISAVGSHTITDFAASAANMLVLRDAGFNLGPVDDGHGTATPQHLAAGEFVANALGSFTGPDQRFAYNTHTGGLFYDPDGNGTGSGKTAVAVLSDLAPLSAGAAGNLFFTA